MKRGLELTGNSYGWDSVLQVPCRAYLWGISGYHVPQRAWKNISPVTRVEFYPGDPITYIGWIRKNPGFYLSYHFYDFPSKMTN